MSDEFKKRILFIGIPDMALVCLEGLLRQNVNIVGVLGPKKDHDTYNMFKNFVANFNLNFIEYDNLTDVDFLEKITALDVDLAVVCSFNYKVPKELLKTTKDGFVNVHPSLLPKYRGANPYSAVIFNGEEETGLTLHFMDETFDTGDIVMQKSIPISGKDTMGTLFNRFNLLALDMLIEMLKLYENSTLPGTKQKKGEFIKAPALSEANLLIDFNKSALEIDRLIRGLNPFILARAFFRNNLVRVLSAEYSQEPVKEGSNGEIIEISDNKIYVKTQKGVLILTAMQFGSFFIGTSKDFIEILNPQVGERFN